MPDANESAYEYKIRQSPEFALRELSAHFDHKSAVYRTLYHLAERLDEAKIPYALAGALAMNEHGYERATTDVDLIMTRDGLEQFREQFVGKGYRLAVAGAQRTFRDSQSQVRLDVFVAGEYPGDGNPKPVSFPDPKEAIVVNRVRVVTFEKLIELKLASGISAPHRLRDLGDVQEMIKKLSLPLAINDKLDASVRGEYKRLWQAVDSAIDPHDEELMYKKYNRLLVETSITTRGLV